MITQFVAESAKTGNVTLTQRCILTRSHIKHKKYRKLGLSKHLEECNTGCVIKDMFIIIHFLKSKDNEPESLS